MPTDRERAHRLVREASSNVAGLICLFEDPHLPGDSASERLRWILRVTASDLPGMHMGLFPPDDSGFRPELADSPFYHDPRYWADFVPPPQRQTKQVGHFLTAVGLALNRWPAWAKLRLIVGHELLGDRRLFGFVRQFLAATPRHTRLFLQAVEHDRRGQAAERDDALRALFGTSQEALRDPMRLGNSLPDLRLSVKGWRFAEEIRSGAIGSRESAAAWLRREIYDPTRTREAVTTPPQSAPNARPDARRAAD